MDDKELDEIFNVPFVIWFCPAGCLGQVEWNQAKTDAVCLVCGRHKLDPPEWDVGRTYLLAGNYREYIGFTAHHKLNRHKWHYIATSQQMLRTIRPRIVTVGTWLDKRDLPETQETIESRDPIWYHGAKY